MLIQHCSEVLNSRNAGLVGFLSMAAYIKQIRLVNLLTTRYNIHHISYWVGLKISA